MFIVGILYCIYVIFSIFHLYRNKRKKYDVCFYKDIYKHTFVLFTPLALILSNNLWKSTIIFIFSLIYIVMIEIILGNYSIKSLAIPEIIKNILLIILMILLYWKCCLIEFL